MVSKLDRLSRSVVDFGGILRAATQPRRGRTPWGLIALNVGIDMTTPTGRMVEYILIVVAEREGDRISRQTSTALAVAKRDHGVLPGPASSVPLM
jgi:DNA invertase Pin-like site-specific DNA recombinase